MRGHRGAVGLARALASDAESAARRADGYFRWNLRGVRVTADCRVSSHAQLETPLQILGGSQVHGRARIGAYSYVRGSIVDNATIGRFCSIAPGCLLGLDDHPLDEFSTSPFARADGRRGRTAVVGAVLGSDVWLGAGVIVLSGVEIGHGAVVGAGAVVTRDLDAGSISVGIPARQVAVRAFGGRFGEEIADCELGYVDRIVELHRASTGQSPTR